MTSIHIHRAYCIITMITVAALACAASNSAFGQNEGDEQQSRIDFGNAYIQGQSIKSGAVYLTNRRKSKIESLLKTRKDYRYEIVKDFYGGEVDLERPELEPESAPVK